MATTPFTCPECGAPGSYRHSEPLAPGARAEEDLAVSSGAHGHTSGSVMPRRILPRGWAPLGPRRGIVVTGESPASRAVGHARLRFVAEAKAQ